MLHIWAHEIYPALSVYTRKQGKLTYRAVHYPFTWGAFIRRHYTQYIHNKIHGVQFDGSNGKPERTKYQGCNTPFYMLYIFKGCTIPLLSWHRQEKTRHSYIKGCTKPFLHDVHFYGSLGKPERTKVTEGWNTPFYMLYIFMGCTIPMCTKCAHMAMQKSNKYNISHYEKHKCYVPISPD